MPPLGYPEIIQYYYRYGNTRAARADRMHRKLGPDQNVPGIPQPLRLNLGNAIVHGVRFSGYVERESAANANTRMRRVRSQRIEVCESHNNWKTSWDTVYNVGLAADMRTAISCNCPDNAEDKCKHMLLCESHMRNRVPVVVRRSARVREIVDRNNQASTSAARRSRSRRAPQRYVPAFAPVGGQVRVNPETPDKIQKTSLSELSLDEES